MPDVLRAVYSDLKTVKTRSTCQLILELPIEALTDVVGLLGAPVPGNEVWVAVARLKPEAATVEQIEDHRPKAKLSQLAGILCNEGGFQRFLTESGHDCNNADEAAEHVRLICGAVPSRRDLDTNTEAGRKFRDLKADYENWRKVVA